MRRVFRALVLSAGSFTPVILKFTMLNAMGFITAGGRSSRMGTDKAWLEIGGQAMIEKVIAALAPVASSLAIIANGPEYNRLGIPVFADEQSGIGPLEAIRTAMANSATPRFLFVGCDLPFVTAALFRFLLSVPGEHQAIVPIGADGKFEPLCAVYRAEALPIVTNLIARGERKVSRLFDPISTRFVPFEELRHLEGSELFFENVNTPEDYTRAVENLQPGTESNT